MTGENQDIRVVNATPHEVIIYIGKLLPNKLRGLLAILVDYEDIIKEINIIDLMIPINKKNKKKVARLIKEKDELLKKLKKE